MAEQVLPVASASCVNIVVRVQTRNEMGLDCTHPWLSAFALVIPCIFLSFSRRHKFPRRSTVPATGAAFHLRGAGKRVPEERFRVSTEQAGRKAWFLFSMKLDKIVDGKPVDHVTVGVRYDSAKRGLTCEFARGVFSPRVQDNKMKGP